jgi:sulfur carrier protein ThiS
MPRKLAAFLFALVMTATGCVGGEVPRSGYKVLAPISHGSLTIFPVVAASAHDTSEFLTLDEGLRSGEVVVAESGQAQGLIRRHRQPVPVTSGAEVNRLVLVNNSSRPLILLAGEIVTGGKQDRVVGKDRIVPAGGDPIDLSVFCVEPGRWTGRSSQFDAKATPMAQPSVRKEAMANKDQGRVWSEVRSAQAQMASRVAAAPPVPGGYVDGLGGNRGAAAEVTATSSYAYVMSVPRVAAQVNAVAVPIERSYQGLIKQLRSQNAVGVVVAVNGEIIWADVFASTQLLEKYWPKLARSYAAEAVTRGGSGKPPSLAEAQQFLNQVEGHELAESEPGVFRETEISGSDYKAFFLTSLLPKSGFDVHFSKMAL